MTSPDEGPEWADEAHLDEVFSTWVPGPPDSASAAEREMAGENPPLELPPEDEISEEDMDAALAAALAEAETVGAAPDLDDSFEPLTPVPPPPHQPPSEPAGPSWLDMSPIEPASPAPPPAPGPAVWHDGIEMDSDPDPGFDPVFEPEHKAFAEPEPAFTPEPQPVVDLEPGSDMHSFDPEPPPPPEPARPARPWTRSDDDILPAKGKGRRR